MKIILLGYMGSGKTTIGFQLAKKLYLDFTDLDEYIEKKEGKTISDIFADKGEIYFRKIEHTYLKQFISENNSYVLSLGGGTPCYSGNIDMVIPKNTVCTIYPQGHPARSTWESNRPSKAPLEISYIHLTRERLRETVLRRKIHSKEDTREFTPAIYVTPAIRAKEKRNKTLAPLLKLALTLGVAFLASAVVRK